MRKDSKKTEKLRFLPTDRIRSGPWQSRKNFDADAIGTLAGSIVRYGMIQPLTVQKKRGEYELICGERRLRAARQIGLAFVPCRVLRLQPRDAAELSMVENLHRRDLDRYEEAMMADKLQKSFRYLQSELADRLGQSPSSLSAKLRFLRFSSEERVILEKNAMTPRHINALLRLHDAAMRLFAVQYTAEHSLSPDECEELCLTLSTHPEDFIPSLRPRESAGLPVRRLVVKDVRLFLNSVDRAILSIRQAGFTVEAAKEDSDRFITYTIRVPKFRPDPADADPPA